MNQIRKRETPDFSKLSSIMERFFEVPYHQLQKELNDWFELSLKKKVEETDDVSKEDFCPLLDLLAQLSKSVYINADVSKQD